MLWVGMGRDRSLLMAMVWVWVQIWRKLLGFAVMWVIVQERENEEKRWEVESRFTIRVRHLDMKNEQFVVVLTTGFDDVLEDPVEGMATADRRVWVAFAGLAHSYQHCRSRIIVAGGVFFGHLECLQPNQIINNHLLSSTTYQKNETLEAQWSSSMRKRRGGKGCSVTFSHRPNIWTQNH